MLTKYILHTDYTRYELTDEDMRNWEDIECSFKRSDYDGVVRSFTSKFEFVNGARDLLQELYLRDGVDAAAVIEVQTIDDNWEYSSRFECPLDFSTLELESNTLRINGVDNSLAALIKANKSTKYEFRIPEEIKSKNTVFLDRLPMKESVTYEITGGESYENCADLLVTLNRGELPYVGKLNEEIAVNGSVDFNDDQTEEATSYVLRAVRDVEMTFDYELAWRIDHNSRGADFGIGVRHGGVPVVDALIGVDESGYMAHLSGTAYNEIKDMPDAATLMELYPLPGFYDWALIDGQVWYARYNGDEYHWANSGQTVADHFTNRVSGTKHLRLKAGDEVYIDANITQYNIQRAEMRVVSSKFVFSWMARGDSVDVAVVTPKRLGEAIMGRIAGDTVNITVDISRFDSRLDNTYLLAAESLRGISPARIYSSFSEYCDWMSAVFGYVYYIDPPTPTRFLPVIRECGRYEQSPWAFRDEFYSHSVTLGNIVYIPRHGRFFYKDTATGMLYTMWPGYEAYNDYHTGRPRTDTLFRFSNRDSSELYYFSDYVDGQTLFPQVYEHSEDRIGLDDQIVHFVHRTELLNHDAPVRRFEGCRDVNYSVDSSVLYSTVKAGYDKKDYESVNGRDEFNFNNTYTTGCTVSDKTLSLLSKYRADSYGIEFALQKRGKDSTDDTADNDVFFILCAEDSLGRLAPDRSMTIKNAISDALFNGAFSPMACIRANEGFIGLQSPSMVLTFASSEGNSGIQIDSELMSDPIILDHPMATAGILGFTTDCIDIEGNENDILEVEQDSIRYRGFLKDVDIKYARTEAAKYQIIVKDIEPC